MSTVWAQSPQKMSYQAVIRDAGNNLVSSHSIGMRIGILQGSETGTVVYQEIYNPNPQTNANGLVTVEIGSGIPTTATFANINWANGPYFIKTETDPTGGTNYTITGVSQLLSVPYALYAETSGTHTIGENYGGGIIFYVYDNGRHGLIASTADQSTGIRWNAGEYTYTLALADGIGAGKTNTALIIASQGNGDGETYAARICNEYSVTVNDVTYGDWYLPSMVELKLLYLQKDVVGGFSVNAYWSSTENSSMEALDSIFTEVFDNESSDKQENSILVRAIRAF
jgi:hypothetical protein